MSQNSTKASARRKRYQRFVGLLTLFFLLTGIAISGANSSREMEELIGFDLDAVSPPAQPVNDSQFYLTSINNGQNDPENSEGDDDDCLCWCSQVLPTQSFEVALPSVTFVVTDSDTTPVLTAPPRLLFHPPRFA